MEILCKFSTKFKVSISKTVFRSRLQTTMMMMTMMTTTQTIHDSGHLRQKRNIFGKCIFSIWRVSGFILVFSCLRVNLPLIYCNTHNPKDQGNFSSCFLTNWRDYQGIHTITHHMKKFPSLLCKYTRELLSCHYSSLHLLDINLFAVTSHSDETNEK